MELDSRKNRRRERTVRSKSFETQEVKEIGQNEDGELTGFLVLWTGMIMEVFQMVREKLVVQERLKICRRSAPEGERCFNIG